MMLGLFLEPVFAKICTALKINRKSKFYSAFQILRTVLIVNFGMLIFRADDLKTAISMFKGIFTRFSISQLLAGSNGFGLSKYDYAAIVVGFVIMVVVGIVQEKGIDMKDKIFKLPYPVKFVVLMVFLFSIIIFGAYGEGYGVVDLIYANF